TTASRNQRSFDVQYVTADFGPRKSHCQSNLIGFAHHLWTEPGRPQMLTDCLASNRLTEALAIISARGNYLSSRLAQHGDCFASEVTHTSFASVILNDLSDRIAGEINLICGQSVCLKLLCNQMTPGNFKLLALGVTGQTNNL